MAVLRNLCKYKEPIQNKRAVKANSILQSLKTWLNGLWCSFLINYRFIITCLNEIFILLSDIGGNNSLGQTSDIIIIFFLDDSINNVLRESFCHSDYVCILYYTVMFRTGHGVVIYMYAQCPSWSSNQKLKYASHENWSWIWTLFFFILIYIIFLHECSLIQNKTNNYTQEIKWHELDCVSKEKKSFSSLHCWWNLVQLTAAKE